MWSYPQLLYKRSIFIKTTKNFYAEIYKERRKALDTRRGEETSPNGK